LRKAALLLVLCWSAFVVAACTINAPARVAPVVYDLGEQPPPSDGQRHVPYTLLVPAVTAPPWLDTTRIAYRLGYQDPRRVLAYNNSRWAATPPMLLTEAVRARFAGAAERVVSGVDGAQADYVLRVDLEDFSQAFDAPDRSRVAVRARATLVDRRTHAIVAQRTFRIVHPAPPDAAGAARVLATASAELIRQLLDWTAQNLNNTGRPDDTKRSGA
jgi:cholesterol transport system auxiliary component